MAMSNIVTHDNSHSCSLEVTNVQRGNASDGLVISSSDASAVKGVLDGPPRSTFFLYFLYRKESYLLSEFESFMDRQLWLMHHLFPLALKQGGPVMKYDVIR